ncbi:hypothetical protein ABOONEI_2467 [Aciduliprofundum boonei T469]|nr:hypothetical protein ABOONEI_2467 [Aciduliprofundum boonei T469]
MLVALVEAELVLDVAADPGDAFWPWKFFEIFERDKNVRVFPINFPGEP